VAEYGIAAHWQYKEGGSPATSGAAAERFNWLRQLVDWQKDGVGADSSDFLASIKEDLFDEEVFVFTPHGDVVGLRKGSTAVDFAYRIHSEVGNHCQGVRINDRLCPLATPLQNGDFVQVITAKNAHPSLDWLNFVATPTARNRIRAWYKRSHREENVLRGTEMLERELGRDGFDLLLNGEALARVARRCNLVGTEDLLATLGFGGVTLQQVVNRLREEVRLATAATAAPPTTEELAARLHDTALIWRAMRQGSRGRPASAFSRSMPSPLPKAITSRWERCASGRCPHPSRVTMPGCARSCCCRSTSRRHPPPPALPPRSRCARPTAAPCTRCCAPMLTNSARLPPPCWRCRTATMSSSARPAPRRARWWRHSKRCACPMSSCCTS
jgi:molybdopterin converting factor small subunit